MRIIGNINHPSLKITVFKTDNRTAVKFENEGYEQTFKLGQDERLATFEDIERWVDEQLVADVQGNMGAMHQSRLAANGRAFPTIQDKEFEDII